MDVLLNSIRQCKSDWSKTDAILVKAYMSITTSSSLSLPSEEVLTGLRVIADETQSPAIFPLLFALPGLAGLDMALEISLAVHKLEYAFVSGFSDTLIPQLPELIESNPVDVLPWILRVIESSDFGSRIASIIVMDSRVFQCIVAGYMLNAFNDTGMFGVECARLVWRCVALGNPMAVSLEGIFTHSIFQALVSRVTEGDSQKRFRANFVEAISPHDTILDEADIADASRRVKSQDLEVLRMLGSLCRISPALAREVVKTVRFTEALSVLQNRLTRVGRYDWEFKGDSASVHSAMLIQCFSGIWFGCPTWHISSTSIEGDSTTKSSDYNLRHSALEDTYRELLQRCTFSESGLVIESALYAFMDMIDQFPTNSESHRDVLELAELGDHKISFNRVLELLAVRVDGFLESYENSTFIPMLRLLQYFYKRDKTEIVELWEDSEDKKSFEAESTTCEKVLISILTNVDDMKVCLIAVETLLVIPLELFHPKEVGSLISLIPKFKHSRDPRSQYMLSQIIFLLFRMASRTSPVYGRVPRSCQGFLLNFANVAFLEVVGLLEELSEHHVITLLDPSGGHVFDPRVSENGLLKACVKFLKCGDDLIEAIRLDSLESEQVAKMLSSILLSEQSVFTSCPDPCLYQSQMCYLEQTVVGRVGLLLQALDTLRLRYEVADVVQFRCLYQLANTLNGSTKDSVLDSLKESGGVSSTQASPELFEQWYRQPSGRVITSCMEQENQPWNFGEELAQSSEGSVKPLKWSIFPAAEEHARSIAFVQAEVWQNLLDRTKLGTPPLDIDVLEQRWIGIIRNTGKYQVFIATAEVEDPQLGPVERVIGYVRGGVHRQSPKKYGEFYEMIVLTEYLNHGLLDHLALSLVSWVHQYMGQAVEIHAWLPRKLVPQEIYIWYERRMSRADWSRKKGVSRKPTIAIAGLPPEKLNELNDSLMFFEVSSGLTPSQLEKQFVKTESSFRVSHAQSRLEKHREFMKYNGIQRMLDLFNGPTESSLESVSFVQRDLNDFASELQVKLFPNSSENNAASRLLARLTDPENTFEKLLISKFKAIIPTRTYSVEEDLDDACTGSFKENLLTITAKKLESDFLEQLMTPLDNGTSRRVTISSDANEGSDLQSLMLSSVLRSLYAISSSIEPNDKETVSQIQEQLRNPLIIHLLGEWVSSPSVDFGDGHIDLNASVRAGYPVERYICPKTQLYSTAAKWMYLQLQLVSIDPREFSGHELCLQLLDCFQGISTFLERLFTRISVLLKCRDEVHRRLDVSIEFLICCGSLLVEEVVSQIYSLVFFTGPTSTQLREANRRVRERAAELIFPQKFLDLLQEFLVYDMEMESSEDGFAGSPEEFDYCTSHGFLESQLGIGSGSFRHRTRMHILRVLSYFVREGHSSRFNMLKQLSTNHGSGMAQVPSRLQVILDEAALDRNVVNIEEALIKSGTILPSDPIIFRCFVSVVDPKYGRRPKIILMTVNGLFISHPLALKKPRSLTGNEHIPDLLSTAFEFISFRRIFRVVIGAGGETFYIAHEHSRELRVVKFVSRAFGTPARISELVSRYSRRVHHIPIRLILNDFTEIGPVYDADSASNHPVYAIRLMSHVDQLVEGKLTRRLLVWVHNKTRKQPVLVSMLEDVDGYDYNPVAASLNRGSGSGRKHSVSWLSKVSSFLSSSASMKDKAKANEYSLLQVSRLEVSQRSSPMLSISFESASSRSKRSSFALEFVFESEVSREIWVTMLKAEIFRNKYGVTNVPAAQSYRAK